MQYEIVFKVIGGVHVILASLKSSSVAQTARRTAAPGTGTGASPVVQRLLTIATPKQVHIYTYIQTRAKTKNKHQTQESYKGTH